MDARLEEIALKVCATHNVGLYDLELKNTQKGKVLLVLVTKATGVSLDDCVAVSRDISAELDLYDWSAKNYFLEVSSPGIVRQLRLKKHWAGAINETVQVTWAEDTNKITTKALLVSVEPDSVTLEINDGETMQIPFSAIKKAKTVFTS